jgi:hypothetical protein
MSKFCHICGTKILHDRKFCGQCGTKIISLENNSHTKHSQSIKPKRNIRKSPIFKGVIIGIISVFVLMSILFIVSDKTYFMINDGMNPIVKKSDLVHYIETPMNELVPNDIIFYDNSGKIMIHKVVRIIEYSPIVIEVKNEISSKVHQVTEDQYIGKLDHIKGNFGEYAPKLLNSYMTLIYPVIAFILPIIIMKIRAQNQDKMISNPKK